MKQKKKQLTEAEILDSNKKIEQIQQGLNRAIELMVKDGMIKKLPEWYKKHTND
jgi:hypothetical protein